jgi:hypothetical protein
MMMRITYCNSHFNGKYLAVVGPKLPGPSCDPYYLSPDYKGATVFLFPVARQPYSGLGRLIIEDYKSHTNGRNPLDGGSDRCRDRYLHNIQHSKETVIDALSGIRTRNPSKPAAADLRLRLCGHRGQRRLTILGFYVWLSLRISDNYFPT